MIKRIVLLVMILMLCLPATAMAAEGGDGMIEGKLINGTEGSTSSLAGLDITLKITQNGNETGTDNATTDAGGQFIFQGLATGPENGYQVTVAYQGAEYDGAVVSFAEGETTKTVELTVFDSIASDEAITVMLAHTIIYVEQGGFRVLEYYVFANSSDLTYVGSQEIAGGGARQTLAFTLPENATDLQPVTGFTPGRIHESGSGFVDTMPVFPGGREVAYSYIISYNSDKYDFIKKVDFPIVNYSLLVQSEAVQILSGALTQQETLQISGTQFNHFSGSDLARGDTIVVQIPGIAVTGTGSQMTYTWVAIALLLLFLGFSTFYILRKRKPRLVRVENSLTDRQELLNELARLDDEFESGRISEADYSRLRAEKKSQLVTLIQDSEKSRDHE